MGQYKPLVYSTFKPTVRVFIVCILSAAIFGPLFYITYFFNKNTEGTVNSILGYGISLLFAIFFTSTLYALLHIKTVITHPSGIIVKYPLLFRTKSIFYRDIVSTEDTPQRIMTGRRRVVYEGTRIWLTMENGKKLEINSLETKDFDTLQDTIKRSIQSAAARKQNEQARG